MLKKLTDIKICNTAKIVKINSSELRKTLLEMGFIPGTIVRKIRCAPLSDPIEFRLRGFNLCLRKKDADHIIVEED